MAIWERDIFTIIAKDSAWTRKTTGWYYNDVDILKARIETGIKTGIEAGIEAKIKIKIGFK